jgi:hypothetical protein
MHINTREKPTSPPLSFMFGSAAASKMGALTGSRILPLAWFSFLLSARIQHQELTTPHQDRSRSLSLSLSFSSIGTSERGGGGGGQQERQRRTKFGFGKEKRSRTDDGRKKKKERNFGRENRKLILTTAPLLSSLFLPVSLHLSPDPLIS